MLLYATLQYSDPQSTSLCSTLFSFLLASWCIYTVCFLNRRNLVLGGSTLLVLRYCIRIHSFLLFANILYSTVFWSTVLHYFPLLLSCLLCSTFLFCSPLFSTILYFLLLSAGRDAVLTTCSVFWSTLLHMLFWSTQLYLTLLFATLTQVGMLFTQVAAQQQCNNSVTNCVRNCVTNCVTTV
jgi:hypothetical protein